MAEIPLILLNLQDEGFHLLVEIELYDQRFKAVVDTGASKTVFDKGKIEAFVEPEAITQSAHLSTGLGTNDMESFILEVPDMRIGSVHIQDYEVALLDLSTINFAYESMEQEPVIGVIGGDLLKRYNAVIDYRHEKMVLETPQK